MPTQDDILYLSDDLMSENMFICMHDVHFEIKYITKLPKHNALMGIKKAVKIRHNFTCPASSPLSTSQN